MISTSPTVAEIDAATKLLSILEMAKDASKLKESLAKIKEAQDAAAAERVAAEQAAASMLAGQRSLEQQQAKNASDMEKLREANALHIRNTEDLANERAAMKDERNRFDTWMAEQREELDRMKSAVAAQASQVNAQAARIEQQANDLAKREAGVEVLESAAKAKIAEYDQKIDNLKQMIS